jgi:hypothetical protein
VIAEVGPARRHLPRHAHQSDGPLGREVAGLKLCGGARSECGGRGRVAQRAAVALAPEAIHQAALDVLRALALYELGGNGPGERLPRLGSTGGPDPRAAADDRAEQPVALEGLDERHQVVVHAEREAQALHAVRRGFPPGGLGAEAHATGCRPGRHHHGLVAVVDEPD